MRRKNLRVHGMKNGLSIPACCFNYLGQYDWYITKQGHVRTKDLPARNRGFVNIEDIVMHLCEIDEIRGVWAGYEKGMTIRLMNSKNEASVDECCFPYLNQFTWREDSDGFAVRDGCLASGEEEIIFQHDEVAFRHWCQVFNNGLRSRR